MRNVNMSRRTFVQTGLGAVLLAGCSGGQANEEPAVVEQSEQAPETVEPDKQEGDAAAGEQVTAPAGKTLVVFYSRADENYADGGTEVLEVGHTKVMAGYIAEALNADAYEIVPQAAYPFSYDECCDQASAELADDVRPEIIGEMPDVSGYDTVFIGCPIWWGDEPMIIRTFVEGVDLSGKTIVPFTTHGGSGLGRVPSNLQAAIPNARFIEGHAVTGTSVDDARDEVTSWAKGLELA
jgi:flavodoxin